jgi:hypothetical protein
MSAKFPVFFGGGVAILAIALWFGFFTTSDAKLALSGEILKVRSMELTPDSTLAILDFRMKNESSVTFVLKEATILWTDAEGKEREATTVSRPDMNRIMEYSKQAGPKYNEMFVVREKLTSKAMLDRMASGTVPVSDADFTKRKGLKLRLTDMDGVAFELRERGK